MHPSDEWPHGYGGYGFKILAALHGGGLELSCSACAEDPQLKSLSGCDEPTQDPVWEYEGDVWYSCPLLFLPETVVRWYEEYVHDKEFGSRMAFKDRPHRWLEAYSLYRGCLNDWQEEASAKHKQEMQALKGAASGKRH